MNETLLRLGFRVQGSGFRIRGSGSMVWGFKFRVQSESL